MNHPPQPVLTIITGSSRGMGQAMALQCLREGHQVIGIARQTSDELAAADTAGRLSQWQADLSDAADVAQRLHDLLQGRSEPGCASLNLINNAGMIAPLQPLDSIGFADTARALRVGLEAAMLLTAAVLGATRHWTVPRKVLNISSGLGRRAMAGSASYCAAKAGMDHFSRAVALEQAALPRGAHIVSLAPGVIATDMQVQLRAADPALFPNREDFVQLQARGQLLSPTDAAAKVLAWLVREDFGTHPVADVRD
jgi:NAD(P)-dependent dehydrogenase (short-subunit alcohol dehydrogenase family)